MQLTRFTDIGLRVVMRLAVAAEQTSAPVVLTTKDLAAELSVPYTHVAKVVGRLSEMGVVHARRGRSGGLTITELGREARVGRLARSLEGDGEVVDCEGPQPCPLRHGCRLRGALARAAQAFYESLDGLTVAELAQEPTSAVLLSLSPRVPTGPTGGDGPSSTGAMPAADS
ncbi:RrF2 family transcriptional regulator [Gordonia paraffinivorans]|uniref:Rrf2 family DNA-binding protein n=1 Tax=Gordonia paraffinivorans NBRC 108238 TaxID=1223543 RepID=A0ABQ0IKE3_9ACTN|nr:Rrf2 family transcriptional regulator [Gordonia paraffinivorans]MCD2145783.1 Rrf2 family transcriptional regulator [Gordonia paraffinivorans]GAC84046.1 putative Rrf2 family DNA-binding protein [Gordonia paraffinivorans NBRC 108238]